MILGFLLIGMLVGTGAAGVTLFSGGGILAALIVYGATGAITLLLPLVAMMLTGDRESQIAEGHGASA